MEYDNKDTGALFKNDKKGNDKAPDYTGDYETETGKKRRIAAWLKTSQGGKPYMSLKFEDSWDKTEAHATTTNQPDVSDGFDDIPF